jgi:hypothetical protein
MASGTFTTDNMFLAAYLYASGLLQLVKVESPNGRFCMFEFADPDAQGPERAREFHAGAEVSAVAFCECFKTLRRFMTAAKQSLN